MEEQLLYYAIKYQGNFNQIYKAVTRNEPINKNELAKMKDALTCSYTTILSKDYPTRLKEIDSPPFVLFYYGDISLCNRDCISMVGMRACSDYGRKMALSISFNLGKTIAVLGSGIDYCYPKENLSLYQLLKEEHLVISEYPGAMIPKKECFPIRNRIVAGLGEKLIVVEAKQRSGTMITVNFSLNQGKDIYCVPNRIGEYDGCNRLISQGADILVDVEDLF